MKGFKVTDSERIVRVGIAVKNFNELVTKTKEKFKLKISENLITFQAPDGTIVDSDEYFQTLQSQTLLIWVKKGEKAQTDAEILYRTIREVNEEYLTAGEKVQEFFTEKMKTKVFKLAEVLKGIDDDKTLLSEKRLHPGWFEGSYVCVIFFCLFFNIDRFRSCHGEIQPEVKKRAQKNCTKTIFIERKNCQT